MPHSRQHAHSDFAGQPPQWMKFAFGILCALILLVAGFGWDQWEDARRDYAAKQRELQAKQEQNAKLQHDTESVAEFLQAYSNNQPFRDRIIRQRTGAVVPGEVILKLEAPSQAAPPAPEPEPKKKP